MKINLEEKNKQLKLDYKLKNSENYKFVNKSDFFSLSIYKKPVWVSGLTSRCQDGKEVFFLDYDNVCRWVVMEDLDILADLAPFYIFATKEEEINDEIVGNYHIISPVKMTPQEVIKCQSLTHCDRSYRTMPLRTPYRNWVLRIGLKGSRNKPRFVEVKLGLNDNNKEVSSAHIEFLRKIYREIPKFKFVNEDKLTKIFINHYQTGNRI